MRVNKEKEAILTYELANSLLDYNPDTGTILWKVNIGSARIGDILRANSSNGYSRVGVNKHTYYTHRLAWLLYYKEWPTKLVDHIDGNKTNNSISNLRLALPSQNTYNATLSNKNTSGYKGVSKVSNSTKYMARIKDLDGKTKYLGLFLTPEEASEAYNKAAKELHGEFYKDTRI
jgi:hypothetical protein